MATYLSLWRVLEGMGEAEQTDTETLEALVEKTRGPRETILAGLRFYGGEADTQQLRRYEDVPSRSYHFKKLEEQGLTEEVGSEDASQGGDAAKEYRLTDLGQEVVEALDETSGTSTVTEIEERLDQAEESIDQINDLLIDMAVHTGIFDEDQAAEYRKKNGIESA